MRRGWGHYSCESKVAQLEFVAPRVHEQVFRLDVPVNDTVVVAPVYRTAQLVDVAGQTGCGRYAQTGQEGGESNGKRFLEHGRSASSAAAVGLMLVRVLGKYWCPLTARRGHNSMYVGNTRLGDAAAANWAKVTRGRESILFKSSEPSY